MPGDGIPQFASPGTRGSGETVAVSQRPEIQVIDQNLTSTVTSGGNEVVEIFAPEGSIYKPISLYVDVDGIDGASGDHFVFIKTYKGVSISFAKASATDGIQFNNSEWRSAAAREPSDTAATLQAIQSARASSEQPIEINYDNATDSDQTAPRTVRLVVEEVSY